MRNRKSGVYILGASLILAIIYFFATVGIT